jgi:beta-phosphoglucomutase-like phosphatase (HAD superfamily)
MQVANRLRATPLRAQAYRSKGQCKVVTAAQCRARPEFRIVVPRIITEPPRGIAMHTTLDSYQPRLASIDGPALIDRSLDDEPTTTSSDKERFSGSRLRYIGNTQTAVAKRTRPRQRRAVILGLEGVLVDTREAATLSWLVALHDGGHDVSIDLLRHLSGVASEELLRIVSGIKADSPEGREIMRQQERIFRTWYLPRILPFVGARRLLQRMKSDGLRVVALSGGSADVAPDLVRASGVADLLDDVVSADGESRDAALNEVITSLVASLGCKRDGIVLVGDSPYDVSAGERAGIDVIALRCGGWTDATLQGALAVYEDHIHLLSQFQTSPLGSLGFSRASTPDYRLARVQ